MGLTHFKFETYEDLYEGLIDEICRKDSSLDLYNRGRHTHTLHNIVEVTHPKVTMKSMDFKLFGYTPGHRWKTFLKQYTWGDWSEWFEKLESKKDQDTVGYMTKPKAHNHSHGNCLLGYSVQRRPIHEVCVYSRTSRLFPTSVLELSLGALIAEQSSKMFPDLDWPRLLWYVNDLQFSALFGFTWLYFHGGLEEGGWLDRLVNDPRYDGIHRKKSFYTVEQFKDWKQGERFAFARINRMMERTTRTKSWIPTVETLLKEEN